MTWTQGRRGRGPVRATVVVAALAWGCRSEAPLDPAEAFAESTTSTTAVVVPMAPATAIPVAAVVPVEPPVLAPAPEPSPYRYASLEIVGSLEASFVAATEPRLGAQLTQVTKRALVWWVDVRRDLRRGDKLEVIYEVREDAEPIVHALWFQSEKLGGARSAVLYKPKGERFARWYDHRGHELEKRLKNGPIREYEQVTSLLRDGRGHRGVDFKAPVGEPILAPFSGRVVRRNWSFRRNGNCLEIVDDRTGTHAYFLHLASIPKSLRAGSRVKRGQVIARSGNTGRSTAPHLHYQLERNERIVDPFRFHETWRASLPEDEKAEAQRLLARFGEMRTSST